MASDDLKDQTEDVRNAANALGCPKDLLDDLYRAGVLGHKDDVEFMKEVWAPHWQSIHAEK